MAANTFLSSAKPRTIPIKVARLDSSQSTPPKFEYSLSHHLTTTISEKDYNWRQYYIKVKICYDLWFIINVTSLCLLFLAFVFLGIGIFFRNVTESLVEVERYNSNTQNVFTWTGGVSIMGAIHSKSDRLCQDGVEWTSRRKRLRRRIFVKYAVEISYLPLFSSRDVCKNKGYRIIGEKECHSVNKCILFEITRMQSVNRRIAALFYASVMKVLKVRPVVRRKKIMISSSDLRGTTTISSLSERRI